jgi:hypothetical protein
VTGRHEVTPPPLLFSAAHLPRILGGDEPPEVLIRERLLRTKIELRPCLVHELPGAWLVDGSVYLGRSMRMELRSKFEHRSWLQNLSVVPKPPFTELAKASLTSTIAGSSWFGHWLMDEIPLHLLAVRYAPAVGHRRTIYDHEPGYLRGLGLEDSQRLETAFVETLVVVDEFAQNAHKTLRYHHARERLRSGIPTLLEKRVFLKRGGTGQARRMSNEDALAERLAREGFEVLEIGKATLEDLRKALLTASVVVSVEGSHLDHALYLMPEGAAMIILNPPARFMTTIPDIAIFCGIDCGIFCCEPRDPAGKEFFADADEVLRFTDEMLDRIRRRADRVRDFVGSVLDLVPADERSRWLRADPRQPALPLP